MLRALVVVVSLAAVVPPATASTKTGFAFGRAGGHIRSFSVVISVDGDVHTSGPVEAHRTTLTRLELAHLNQLAVTTGFTRLETRTNCSGTLPDVAMTYIRVGARTVRMHGNCVAAYRKLWTALRRAAQLTF